MARSKITGDTPIEVILSRNPDAARVFVRLGLPCFVCGEPAWGTVAEPCQRHRKDLEGVLAELNRIPTVAGQETNAAEPASDETDAKSAKPRRR